MSKKTKTAGYWSARRQLRILRLVRIHEDVWRDSNRLKTHHYRVVTTQLLTNEHLIFSCFSSFILWNPRPFTASLSKTRQHSPLYFYSFPLQKQIKTMWSLITYGLCFLYRCYTDNILHVMLTNVSMWLSTLPLYCRNSTQNRLSEVWRDGKRLIEREKHILHSSITFAEGLPFLMSHPPIWSLYTT